MHILASRVWEGGSFGGHRIFIYIYIHFFVTKKTERKTESVLWRISSWMSLENAVFSFSVFQFLLLLRKCSGIVPEPFCNEKNEKLNPYGESFPGCLWNKQFFSFSVFFTAPEISRIVPELFRNEITSGAI